MAKVYADKVFLLTHPDQAKVIYENNEDVTTVFYMTHVNNCMNAMSKSNVPENAKIPARANQDVGFVSNMSRYLEIVQQVYHVRCNLETIRLTGKTLEGQEVDPEKFDVDEEEPKIIKQLAHKFAGVLVALELYFWAIWKIPFVEEISESDSPFFGGKDLEKARELNIFFDPLAVFAKEPIFKIKDEDELHKFMEEENVKKEKYFLELMEKSKQQKQKEEKRKLKETKHAVEEKIHELEKEKEALEKINEEV